MKLYLDSSALVKLVQRDEAATLAPSTVLRSPDAVHLASARLLGSDLRAVVTYDARMVAVGSGLGMPVESPGLI